MTTKPPTDPSTSIACSHLCTTKHLLYWRIFLSLYFFILWLLVQILSIKWYAAHFYFTIWTLNASLIYIILATYSTFLHYQHSHSPNKSTTDSPNHVHDTIHNHDSDIEQNLAKTMDSNSSNSYTKCAKFSKYASVMQYISCSTTITVVIVFWGILAPQCNCWSYIFTPMQIQTHGVTAILTLTDFYICSNSMSFKQTWWKLMIYGLSYLIFSMIFVFAAGYPIYFVLDWEHEIVLSLISSTGIMGMTLLAHAILCWTNNKLMVKRVQFDGIQKEIDVEMKNNKNKPQNNPDRLTVDNGEGGGHKNRNTPVSQQHINTPSQDAPIEIVTVDSDVEVDIDDDTLYKE